MKYRQAVLGAIAGALLSTVLLQQRSGGRKAGLNKTNKKAMVLLIWIEFPTITDRDTFIELFTPLAKHVAANEPGTLAYELSIADNNELKVSLFERYTDRQYFETVHRTSAPYLHFQKQVADKVKMVSKSGQSYIETDIGYM